MAFVARRRDRPSERAESPRAEWYDRNPFPQELRWEGTNIAPHVDTVRANYTVPSGKKAVLVNSFLQTERVTAATSVGAVSCRLICWIIRGVPPEPYRAEVAAIRHYNNTVNYLEIKPHSLTFVLPEASYFELRTSDYSTGGANNYIPCILFTEFDA